MKGMLNFMKFLQNRVFQVFLRGYTCFLSKKSNMQKSWSRPVVRTLDLLGPTVYSSHSDPKGRKFESPVETNFFACLIFLIKNTYTPVKISEKHDFEGILKNLTLLSWFFWQIFLYFRFLEALKNFFQNFSFIFL